MRTQQIDEIYHQKNGEKTGKKYRYDTKCKNNTSCREN